MLKKFARGALYVILFLILLRACGIITLSSHEHDWQEATCTEPRICSSCKAEEGEPLGHDWQEATCSVPKTCARCGEIDGSRLEHTWVAATCLEPEHCSACGKTRHWYSTTSSHDWQRASCTEPEVCAVCGKIGDGPGEHSTFGYGGEVIVEATCQSGGVVARECWKCGAVVEVPTQRKVCSPGDWTIIQEATPGVPGIKVKVCSMCGKETDRREYEYSASTGSSVATGNGNNFNTYDNESQQNTSAKYVLNTSTSVFHRPSCRDVPKISPSNYSTTNRTRDDLVSSGWRACGHCSP